MKKFDYEAVDGRLLRTFLAILDEASVSRAAAKLGTTQSAVSHSLAKMRKFFGDPLFVRSGSGLSPTKTATSLRQPVQEVLDGLRTLAHRRAFDPKATRARFVVAANDLQRDLIFPQLLRELEAEEIWVEFEFIPSGHPSLAMMRDDQCDLAVTPVAPNGSDIVQKSLFSANMMCFFDADAREPPGTIEEYYNADHILVRFPNGGSSRLVLTGVDQSKMQKSTVCVPNFDAVSRFVTGTRRIATEIDLMKLCTLSRLDMAPLPFESAPVVMLMIWHERRTSDPAHVWLRQRIQAVIDSRSLNTALTNERERVNGGHR